METQFVLVEFLCLRCGLQGLSNVVSESSEAICPKCGDSCITAGLLEKDNSMLLTV